MGEVNLGALTTGILKHTVAAGVSTPATATPGTDYAASVPAVDITDNLGDATHNYNKLYVKEIYYGADKKIDLTVAPGDITAGTGISISAGSGTGALANGGATLTVASAPQLILAPAVADHAYSGISFTATAGETVAIGDVCFLKSDGKYWIAKADVATTKMPGVVIAAAAINADATGIFLAYGFLRDDSWAGWTVGQELFVTITGTTGNTVSATAPSATGNIVQKIGYAYGAKVIFFNPNQTSVEVP